MKLYKICLLFISSMTAIHFISSCERDDICAEDTPKTPLLIIKFIDNNTASDIKQPTDLAIRSTDPLITDSIANIVAMDSIMIPLKTDADITEFEFITNATNDDITLINRDTISFQYTRQEEYVNSACGFRVNYYGLGKTLTQEEDDDNWIKDIIIQNEDITDETTAHILILH